MQSITIATSRLNCYSWRDVGSNNKIRIRLSVVVVAAAAAASSADVAIKSTRY